MKKSLVFMFCVLMLGISLCAVNFSGTWTYYFRWNCNGPYSQTTITFNTNGTFTWGTQFAGKWYQIEDHNITWEFTNGTTYSGTKVGGVMTGMMMYTLNPPTTGCWYCVKQGYFISPADIQKDIKAKVVSNPDTPPLKSPSPSIK